MTPDRASDFAAYVAPARARPQLWRLAVGLVLCAAVYVGFIGAVYGATILLLGAEDAARFVEAVAAAETPTDALLLLFTFLGMALGPVLAARWLHRRAAATLFGPRGRVIRHFGIAAGIVALVYVMSILIWLIWFDARPQLDLTLWLSFLPLAIAGLLLQTGAEELAFRGYLQQQLAARFASPLIWMVLPALIFGAVHYDPAGAGGNVWLVVASAALFGLVAADLTAVTGSLGAAWGFHFANNFFALLVLSVQGTIPGLALFVTPYGADDAGILRPLMLADLAMLGVTWALVRHALRR